jgi:hypothetical protein
MPNRVIATVGHRANPEIITHIELGCDTLGHVAMQIYHEPVQRTRPIRGVKIIGRIDYNIAVSRADFLGANSFVPPIQVRIAGQANGYLVKIVAVPPRDRIK